MFRSAYIFEKQDRATMMHNCAWKKQDECINILTKP